MSMDQGNVGGEELGEDLAVDDETAEGIKGGKAFKELKTDVKDGRPEVKY